MSVQPIRVASFLPSTESQRPGSRARRYVSNWSDARNKEFQLAIEQAKMQIQDGQTTRAEAARALRERMSALSKDIARLESDMVKVKTGEITAEEARRKWNTGEINKSTLAHMRAQSTRDVAEFREEGADARAQARLEADAQRFTASERGRALRHQDRMAQSRTRSELGEKIQSDMEDLIKVSRQRSPNSDSLFDSVRTGLASENPQWASLNAATPAQRQEIFRRTLEAEAGTRAASDIDLQQLPYDEAVDIARARIVSELSPENRNLIVQLGEETTETPGRTGDGFGGGVSAPSIGGGRQLGGIARPETREYELADRTGLLDDLEHLRRQKREQLEGLEGVPLPDVDSDLIGISQQIWQDKFGRKPRPEQIRRTARQLEQKPVADVTDEIADEIMSGRIDWNVSDRPGAVKPSPTHSDIPMRSTRVAELPVRDSEDSIWGDLPDSHDFGRTEGFQRHVDEIDSMRQQMQGLRLGPRASQDAAFDIDIPVDQILEERAFGTRRTADMEPTEDIPLDFSRQEELTQPFEMMDLGEADAITDPSEVPDVKEEPANPRQRAFLRASQLDEKSAESLMKKEYGKFASDIYTLWETAGRKSGFDSLIERASRVSAENVDDVLTVLYYLELNKE